MARITAASSKARSALTGEAPLNSAAALSKRHRAVGLAGMARRGRRPWRWPAATTASVLPTTVTKRSATEAKGTRSTLPLTRPPLSARLPRASVDRSGPGLAAGRGDQQVGERGLGERHGHGVRAGEPQQRQHVGQRTAHAVPVLGHGDQRQAHLLDLLPEIGGPPALLHLVDHGASRSAR